MRRSANSIAVVALLAGAAFAAVRVQATVREAPAAAAGLPGLFWEVRSPTGTLYVLGGIRVLTPALYPLRPAIEAAFHESSRLAVAANPLALEEGARDQATFVRAGTYRGAESLAKHITPETLDVVTSAATAHGLDTEELSHQKPWLVGFALSEVALSLAGVNLDRGFEHHFVAERHANQAIVEFSNVAEELSVLESDTPQAQEAALRINALDIDHARSDYAAAERACHDGSLPEFEAVLTGMYARYPEAAALDRRDRAVHTKNLLPRFEEYLQSGQSVFAIVDTEVLIMPEGLLAGLAAKGYSVERR